MKILLCHNFYQQSGGEDQVFADESWLLHSRGNQVKCAIGFCGHCQFGTTFVCRDGPVFRYDRVRDLINLKEI